jgi:hypothetical protein
MTTLASNALTTRSKVYTFRQLDGKQAEGTSDFNLMVDYCINAISEGFENYCQRTFALTTHTETYNGAGAEFLYTNNYPITSVSGLYDDESWGWGSDTAFAANDYKISNDKKSIRLYDSIFFDEEENVKIIYTAGYSTIPADLETACIMEVCRMIDKFMMKTYDVQGNSNAGGDSQTFITDNYLPQTITVLNRYKRKVAY